ncbi:MAG: hypothetical protein FWD54_07215 [Endomicrobia bacterium]|nr:hypothetical protein [Endomicrobiia bacterium]MCL2800042.1 hypothetical protein [Endomicrobiia bacterium]
MSSFTSGLLRLIGFGGMAYGLFVIIKWYIYWLSYHFVGSIEPAMMIGLVTFFLSPIAGIVDLFWHSFMPSTVDMWIQFLGYFVGGRLVFAFGHKYRQKG